MMMMMMTIRSPWVKTSSADEPPVASRSGEGLTGQSVSVPDPMSGECENNASVTSDVTCSYPTLLLV